MYENHYKCPCGATWSGIWDCMCDDRCPACGMSCNPVKSIELSKEEPHCYVKLGPFTRDKAEEMARTICSKTDPTEISISVVYDF